MYHAGDPIGYADLNNSYWPVSYTHLDVSKRKTYIIEELRCDSNKGFELIPPFEIVVSRNNVTVDLGLSLIHI